MYFEHAKVSFGVLALNIKATKKIVVYISSQISSDAFLRNGHDYYYYYPITYQHEHPRARRVLTSELVVLTTRYVAWQPLTNRGNFLGEKIP